ncbi:MAG: serine/threonine protein kinase [Chloroflexota bacterium]|nr:serine/threonine protein kinase [Chloroflexota bacterium]
MTATWTGKTLDNRYIVEQPLGSGATATVYEAQDTQLERRVAVKVLHPQGAADPQARAAFQHEAQLAAGLHHPHLAQVYDAGMDDGLPYIVMERVGGAPPTVGQRLEVGQVVDLGLQVAGALAFVHDQGLLHCDVKPANLLIDPVGTVKLVDFGGAGANDRSPSPAPKAGGEQSANDRSPSPGALPYLAPERLAGAPPSPAADVYSLGAVLYTLLAGVPPYAGATTAALAQQAGSPRSLREHNPTVPAGLAALISRALAPAPADRFVTAGALQEALAAVQDQSRQVTAAFTGTVAAPSQLLPAPEVRLAPVPEPIKPQGVAPTGATTQTFAPSPLGAAPTVATPLMNAPTPPATAPRPPTTSPRLAPLLPRWAIPAIAGILLLGLLALPAAKRSQSPTAAAGPPATATAIPISALQPAPQLLGMTIDEARALVQQQGWVLVAAPPVDNSSVAAGKIVAQIPEAATPLTAGSPITVTASLGALLALPPTVAPAISNTGAPPAPPAPGGDKGKGDKGNGKDNGKGNGKGGK